MESTNAGLDQAFAHTMSLKRADPNEQTGLDMIRARHCSTVSVEAVRNYLHRMSPVPLHERR